MGYELYVEREARLVRVSLFGPNSAEQHLQWLNDLVNQPDWLPDFDVLVDARKLTNPDLYYPQAREITQYAQQLNERLGTGRHAVVGDTDLLYGYCCMAKQLCCPCFREILVFRDIREAEQWLGIGETGPGPHSRIQPREPQGQPATEEAGGGRKR
jgi:hypothetical protein